VVTLGSKGAVAVAGERVERVDPPRIAADGPGSGDVFAATLLVALAEGDDLADALARATQAALDSLA
jgi:sugar/nucleoside kinase (ribokinase family)